MPVAKPKPTAMVHFAMKSPRCSLARTALPLAFSIAVLVPELEAATVTKADNTSVLDLGASWTGAVAPGAGDIATWSGAYNAAGSLSAAFTASTPVSWSGIAVGGISGTAAGLISIGGTGTAVAGSQVTIGTDGINLSGANQNLVINAATAVLSGTTQTWNVATGRNVRFGTTGTGGANANLDGTAGTIITVTGGGLVDLNQGGSTGFADAAGFAGFNGKWVVDASTTLRGLRHGSTAFGTNTAADTITLQGGTLATGGISGAVGNWAWNTPITLATSTSSIIDNQNISGSGRWLKFSAPITGSGNVTFASTGVGTMSADTGFILASANTLSGTVTINGGAFVRLGGLGGTDITTGVGGAGDLGTAAITNNGTLTLSRNDTWTFANTVSGSGVLRIGVNTGSATHIVTVSGNNSHTGGTTLQSAVTLKIGHANAMGTGTFTIAGNGIFDNLTGSALTVANSLTMSGGSPTFTGTDDMTINGAVLISGANRNITVTSVGKTLTLGGNIGQDIVGRVFTKNGLGTMVLSGASNTYDGGTNINDGYLRFGATSLPATGNVTLNSGGALVADGPFTTVMGWLGSGRIAAASAGSIAITGNSSEAIDFTGFASLGLSTNAAAATFSGTIAGTATYRFAGESNTALTVATTLTGANGVTKSDGSTVTLTGNNAYTGVTTINGGALVVDSISNGGVNSPLGAAASANTNIVFGSGVLRYTGAGLTTDRSFSVSASAAGGIEASGTGALIFDGTGGAMGFNAATGTRTLVLGGTSASGIVNQMNVVIGDNIGATSLTKNGSGTWRLGGANTYTGTTTINDGLLIAAGGSAIGDSSSVVLANAANATLRLDASETIGVFSGGGVLGGTVNLNGNDLTISPAANADYNGILIGSGTLIKNGTGQLRLGGLTGTPGSSTFSGTHLVNAGLLIFTSTGADDGMPNATINGDANSGIVIGDSFVDGKLRIGALSGTGGKIRADWNPTVGQRTLAVTQSTDTTFAGVFEDSTAGRIVGLEKNGSGTLTLSGVSTAMTGTTTVNAGTLLVTGSISGSATTVLGGTLSGTGTVGALSVNAGGTVAPGASPGILNSGSTTFNGGTLVLELNGTAAGTDYDQLNVAGTVSLAADSPLTISLGFDPADGVDFFTILNNDLGDGITGAGLFSFSGNPLSEGEIFSVGAEAFSISYTGGDGNDVVLAAVPEPAGIAMLLGGLGVLAARRRRR